MGGCNNGAVNNHSSLAVASKLSVLQVQLHPLPRLFPAMMCPDFQPASQPSAVAQVSAVPTPTHKLPSTLPPLQLVWLSPVFSSQQNPHGLRTQTPQTGTLLPCDRQCCPDMVQHKGLMELLLLLILHGFPRPAWSRACPWSQRSANSIPGALPRAGAQVPTPAAGQQVLLCHQTWLWLHWCHLFVRHSPVSRCAVGAVPKLPDPAGAPALQPGSECRDQCDLQPR